MAYKKASEHFFFYEFSPSGSSHDWLPPNYVVEKMIRSLASNLQIVRDNMPANSFLIITSGMRSLDDTLRLIKNGYHPSATSDHNYGMPVSIDQQSPKYKIFGQYSSYSVGAVDCIPGGTNSTAFDVFKLAVRLTKENKTKFGQVIYEENPQTGSKWIHFGNDPLTILSPDIVKLIAREQFLKSVDGGKTYQSYTA